MKQVPQEVKEAAQRLSSNNDLKLVLDYCVGDITTEMLHTYDETAILTLHKQVTGLITLPDRVDALVNA